MRNIIILLIISLSVISCSKQGSNQDETDLLENIISQEEIITSSGEIIETQTGETSTSLSAEIELKDELIEITHNNFKPSMDSLKEMDKESLKMVDCETYFYFPELDKRPDYQVEIYNDYISECNILVENVKK